MNVKRLLNYDSCTRYVYKHNKSIANHEWDLLPSYNYSNSKYLSTYLVKRDRQHIL